MLVLCFISSEPRNMTVLSWFQKSSFYTRSTNRFYPVATGSAATTGGASAASSACMSPDPGQFATPGAPGAPAPAAVPMTASIAPTPPADAAPAGPAAAVPAVPAVAAAAVPEFPTDIKCAQLSLAATLNIGGVQFRPDWPNCSTDYLQFSLLALETRLCLHFSNTTRPTTSQFLSPPPPTRPSEPSDLGSATPNTTAQSLGCRQRLAANRLYAVLMC